MNSTQRLLVIAALVVIGLILPFLMLEWSDGLAPNITPIITFYQRPNPKFPYLTDVMGIYTRYGAAGSVLGILGPLCLFAIAAVMALDNKKHV